MTGQMHREVTPDIGSQGADMLKLYDAAGVQQKCLWRAVYTKIEGQNTFQVVYICLIRVPQLPQPTNGGVAFVFVIDPKN